MNNTQNNQYIVPNMKNPVYLSLKTWPQQPVFSQNVSLSPATSRLIKNIDIKLSSILPLTFTQFLLSNDFSFSHKEEAQQLYQQQIKRRKKMIDILRQIYKNRNNKSLSKSKNQNPKSLLISKQKRKSTKKSLSVRSVDTKQRQSRSKENGLTIFKTRPNNRRQEYQQYYMKSKQKKIKNSYQEESTKSRHKNLNLNLSSSYNEQYYPRHQKIRKSLKSSRNPTTNQQPNKNKSLYKELQQIVSKLKKKLIEIEETHREEIREINQKQLSNKERKRLLKIHKIQKEKVINQIFNIRKQMPIS